MASKHSIVKRLADCLLLAAYTMGISKDSGKQQTSWGGDAPAGYDQVMDNKGLLIAGASIVAGVVLGRMRFPDLESFEHFGARGAVSGRPFNPDLAGGPIENLTIDGVTINREGIAIVEKHISRFDHDPANDVMISRLKK